MYQIAIPSYKRSDSIKSNTLTAIAELSLERITIFVANKEEYNLYKEQLPEYKIVIGKEGLKEQRNYISNYYKEGEYIVSIDDDIKEILEKKDNKLVKLYDIDSWIKNSFEECIKNKSNLWGVYPVCNQFFMKEKTTTDLRFIIGSFFGYINSKIFLTLSEKDDYERSILYYLRDKSVIRFWNITVKSKYYKQKGGLQENNNRRKEQEKAVEFLLTEYPELVSRKKSFKSNFPEIKLKIKSKCD